MRAMQFFKRGLSVATLTLAFGTAHAALAVQAVNSFQVFAKENSTASASNDATPLNTGLFFAVGDTLGVTASGLWNGGGGCSDNGPDGADCFGDGLPGVPYFALVAKIGGDGDYFKVGSSYSGTALTSGNLYLAFLDSDSLNNAGFVTADVVGGVAAVPEPETYALMLAGLGVIATMARRRARTTG